MSNTYLTTEQLADLIHYDPRTIRNQLKDSVLLEGVHYVRPFGRHGDRLLVYGIQCCIYRSAGGLLPVRPEGDARGRPCRPRWFLRTCSSVCTPPCQCSRSSWRGGSSRLSMTISRSTVRRIRFFVSAAVDG